MLQARAGWGPPLQLRQLGTPSQPPAYRPHRPTFLARTPGGGGGEFPQASEAEKGPGCQVRWDVPPEAHWLRELEDKACPCPGLVFSTFLKNEAAPLRLETLQDDK